jgi:hypothetical protein
MKPRPEWNRTTALVPVYRIGQYETLGYLRLRLVLAYLEMRDTLQKATEGKGRS